MNDYEAYTYIWRDSINRKFYIGKHLGLVEDNYAHSSTVMESFNMDSVPPGFKQKILAYGTHEEMCELEHKLLLSRKKKGDWKWDQYHNNWLGDPRFIDMSGENNPMYGKTGENNPMYGKTHTLATRKKLSEAQSGEKNPMYGKTHTTEARKRMSEAHSGKTIPPETRKKMSEAHSGKTIPPETRKRISEAVSGENHPMYGKTHTLATRKKLSEAWQRRKRSKETTQFTLEKFF